MYVRSTIRPKYGQCGHPGCTSGGPLTKGLCQNHYWQASRLKSAAKAEERGTSKDESLSAVMDDLDAVFSQFIRLRDADEWGYCTCVTCGTRVFWKLAECAHFMPRGLKYTRYSEDNCQSSCPECNENWYKRDPVGYTNAFARYLETIREGLSQQLEEQAATVYRYSVSEIKGLISHYSKEVNAMRKRVPEVKS